MNSPEIINSPFSLNPMVDAREVRKNLRYRLATLLTDGHFELALQEAKVAFVQRKIQTEDFEFVSNIVKVALSKNKVPVMLELTSSIR